MTKVLFKDVLGGYGRMKKAFTRSNRRKGSKPPGLSTRIRRGGRR